jgi:pheromone shutdown protein TraB
VALLSKTAPHQKRILVDQRDKRIFRELNAIKGKNIVAVVNQWHLEGVETHWRRYTKTELSKPDLSPIADMDIDAVQ